MNERDEILTEAAGELYKKLEDKSLKAVSMEAVFDALGIDYTGPYLLPEDVKALADLLMPPTCRPVLKADTFGDSWVSCSLCGEPLVINAYVKPRSYYPRCMGCGAVVVKK